jgi:O-antigen/teichoic acid export membrane protein
MLIYLGVFLLSASTLAFEIVLSRLFSIAQFYHFAFITVSLGILSRWCCCCSLSSLRAC